MMISQRIPLSATWSRCSALYIATGIEIRQASTIAQATSSSVSGSARMTESIAGSWNLNDCPKSPCRTPRRYERYWRSTGRS